MRSQLVGRSVLSTVVVTALSACLVGALVVEARTHQDDDSLCRLVTVEEISEAFAGELTVEVQDGATDGCTYQITERSMSFLRFLLLEEGHGANLMAGSRRMLDEGQIEGRLLENLGQEALLNTTNQVLSVRLPDETVFQVAISIYGEMLRPLVDDEQKEDGLVALGRLAVERMAS